MRSFIVCVLVSAAAVAAALSGLPESIGMERASAAAAALLVIAAVCWITEVIPLHITSLLVLAVALVWIEPMTDAGPTAYLSPFFSNVILLFLGGFTLSAALHKLRIDEQIARFVLARAGGSMPALLAALMLVTAFLSMWLSNTATAAMMLALCTPLAGALPEGDRARKALFLAVPIAANVGGIGTPVGTPPNAIAKQYLAAQGMDVSFLGWMLAALPLLVLLLAAGWAILARFYKGSGATLTMPKGAGVLRDWRYKLTLITALATVGLWLFGGEIGIRSGTAGLLPVLVLFGAGVLKDKDFRSMPWDVLILMGGGLCLGAVIDASGLADWIVGRLPEGVSPAVLVLIMGGLACGLSCVMSNTAAANLILPIAAGFASSGTLTPDLMSIALCCSVAMALPVSTPPNAIAFSSGELKVQDLVIPGLAMTVLGYVVVATFGRWWIGVVM